MAPSIPASSQPLEFDTHDGAHAVVKPPPPARRPEPEPRGPRGVVVPAQRPEAKRDAFVRALYEEHGEFIVRTCQRQQDVGPESARDLAQQVVLVALADHDRGEAPDNMRGYLTKVIRNVASNHRREWEPPVEPGADVDTLECFRTGPLTAAQRTQMRAMVMGYMARLPEAWREVVEMVDRQGMTIEAVAAALDRPGGTVGSQLARGRARLRELLAADEADAGK